MRGVNERAQRVSVCGHKLEARTAMSLKWIKQNIGFKKFKECHLCYALLSENKFYVARNRERKHGKTKIISKM